MRLSIIGLPGESVEIKDGVIYIHKEDGNVLPLDEPYITEQAKDAYTGGKISENDVMKTLISGHNWTQEVQR